MRSIDDDLAVETGSESGPTHASAIARLGTQRKDERKYRTDSRMTFEKTMTKYSHYMWKEDGGN